MLRNRRLLGGVSLVAFHAVISSGTIANIAQNEGIVFDHVMMNLGNCYHSNHGVFIAPRTGLYMFSVSISSENKVNVHNVDTAIVKNDAILANTMSRGTDGTADQGSVTVLVMLEEGDEVWVKNTEDRVSAIRGWGFSSFTGVLLSFP